MYLIAIKIMSDIVNVSVNSSRHLVKLEEANIYPGLSISSKEGPIGRKMGVLATGKLRMFPLRISPLVRSL